MVTLYFFIFNCLNSKIDSDSDEKHEVNNQETVEKQKNNIEQITIQNQDDDINNNSNDDNKKKSTNNQEVNVELPVFNKEDAGDKWNTKVNFISNSNVLDMLKETARELELRINFQINHDLDLVNFKYESEKKEFRLIIIEICEILGLKVFFQNKNAKILKDEIYSKNYSIQSLLSKRNMQGTTDLESKNSNLDKGQINYNSTTDFFEELLQNLENFCLQYPTVRFFINKQSGLVNIVGTQKNHKIIASYFDKVLQASSKQILIEAKIMEVTLTDEYEQGINWNMLSINGIINKAFNSATAPQSIFFIKNSTSEDGNILNFIKCLEKFGKIETISNPRLSITHNKPGIFKAIDNKVYFTTKQENVTINDKSKTTFKPIINSEERSIQIGVTILLDVISIDEEFSTVMLKLTISDLIEYVVDPAIYKLTNCKEMSKVPQTRIRELDTVITLKNKELVCIGGSRSIHETDCKTNNWFLNILGSKEKKKETKEIVILLETTNVSKPIQDCNLLSVYQQE